MFDASKAVEFMDGAGSVVEPQALEQAETYKVRMQKNVKFFGTHEGLAASLGQMFPGVEFDLSEIVRG